MGAMACTGNMGWIKSGSCNKDFACQDNEGIIARNSCNYESACPNNQKNIRKWRKHNKKDKKWFSKYFD